MIEGLWPWLIVFIICVGLGVIMGLVIVQVINRHLTHIPLHHLPAALSCNPQDPQVLQTGGGQDYSQAQNAPTPQVNIITQEEILPEAGLLLTQENLNNSSSGQESIPTYYRDPQEMTPQQIYKFQTLAHPKHMTLLDYQRWLRVIADPENLTSDHQANWRRIRANQPLQGLDWLIGPGALPARHYQAQ
jgi:hypothetical protein